MIQDRQNTRDRQSGGDSHRLAMLEAIVMSAAHKLNNSLCVLKLETDTVMNSSIQKQVDQIADIVQLLQQCARRTVGRISQYRLSDVVTGSIKLCQLLHGQGLKVTCTLASCEPQVYGDVDQMRRLVIDLICYCAGIQETRGSAAPHVEIYENIEDDRVILSIGCADAKKQINIVDMRLDAKYLDGSTERFDLQIYSSAGAISGQAS